MLGPWSSLIKSSLRSDGKVKPSASTLKKKQSAKVLVEDTRLRIFALLQAVDYAAKHRKLQNLRLAGTGNWLFQQAKYIEWETSDSSAFLFCRGIRKFHRVLLNGAMLTWPEAGCGKSILA